MKPFQGIVQNMWLRLFLLALAVTALSRYLTSIASKAPFAVFDSPGERSLHIVPMSRVGGIALVVAAATGIVAAVLTKVMSFEGTVAWSFLAAATLIFACSAVEDLYGLSPAVRFVLQSASAVIVVGGIAQSGFQRFTGMPDWLFLCCSVIGIVWMSNLFNFMDGSDGLAGGMSLFGFSVLAVVAVCVGVWLIAVMAALVAAATLGFLTLNVPPARIFMGDAGSVTLGFAAAALSAVLVLQYDVSPYVPALTFAPFLLDATITLVRRLWQMEKAWLPHRQHWYQRLILAGWSHRQVLQLYWPLMIVGGAVGVLIQSDWLSEPMIAVLGVTALHILIPILVWSAERETRTGGAERARP